MEEYEVCLGLSLVATDGGSRSEDNENVRVRIGSRVVIEKVD